jgi:hypothetical protein
LGENVTGHIGTGHIGTGHIDQLGPSGELMFLATPNSFFLSQDPPLGLRIVSKNILDKSNGRIRH